MSNSAITSAATLPAPDWNLEGDIDVWAKRNAGCAAPVGYVSAVSNQLFTFVKAVTAQNKERNARLDALESRAAGNEMQLATLKRENDGLKAEVADLKARPHALKYCGVWSADVPVHQQGDAVTERSGVWIAMSDTRSRPGESRDWQLALRAGRDGKDLR